MRLENMAPFNLDFRIATASVRNRS